jgi:hypothetical protein
MNWCISRFLKKTGGRYSAVYADYYFVLRIEDTQTLWNIRNWRNVNLLYEVKFYRRKTHRFLQQEKVKKASCFRRFAVHTWPNTAPHFDEWWIVFMIYEKKSVFKNKIWMNSNENLGSFCCAQACGDLNYDQYWYMMDSSIHTSLEFVPVFVSIYTRYRNTN